MRTIGLVCRVSCVVMASFAVAQDYPKAELYGGYSYVNIDTNGLSSRQSANGWEASVSGAFNKWFAVEGDVSGYYKTLSGVNISEYFFGGGPRVNFRPLFVHALIGGDHLTGSALGESESQDSLAGAFGGGVEWRVSSHFSVRASVDYAFTRHNILGGPSYTQNNVRAGGGIVYTFGSHRISAASVPREPSQQPAPAKRSVSAMPIPQLGIAAAPVETGGAEIKDVAPGSIAEFAGLRAGDVVTAVDGSPIKSPMELQAALSDRAPGSKVKLTYVHRYWQSDTVVILK